MTFNDCNLNQLQSHNGHPTKAVWLVWQQNENVDINKALNVLKNALDSLEPGGIFIIFNPPKLITSNVGGVETDLEKTLESFSKSTHPRPIYTGIFRLARLVGFIPLGADLLSSADRELLNSVIDQARVATNYFVFKKLDKNSGNLLPKVSLLTAAYRSKYFLRSAASAISQTYPNFEWIICDEGADPEFPKIIEAIAKEFPSIRLKYHKNPKPLGALGNILKCMSLATGKYIKFLDDDDFHEENCMADFVSAFEAFEDYLNLVCSSRKIINNKDEFLYVTGFPFIEKTKNCFLLNGPQTVGFCLNHTVNWIGEPNAAMFRTADVTERFVEIKTQDYYGHLDFVMWINLLAKGNLFYFATPKVFYRLHPKQTIHNPKYMKIMIPIWYEMVKFAEERYQLLGSFYSKALMGAVQVFESELNRCKQSLSQEDFAELSLKLEAAKRHTSNLVMKGQPVIAMNAVKGLELNFS